MDFPIRRSFTQKNMENIDVDRKAAEQELRESTQDTKRAERRREELDNKLENINASLRDIRDDRRKGRDKNALSSWSSLFSFFSTIFTILFPNYSMPQIAFDSEITPVRLPEIVVFSSRLFDFRFVASPRTFPFRLPQKCFPPSQTLFGIHSLEIGFLLLDW
jgi:hypothetical protein